MDYLLQIFRSLLPGVQYTLGIFIVTIVCALPLGLILSFMRNSKNPILRGFTGGYVWLMRGTPLLLQLFFFYYGLPFLPFVGEFLVMERFQAACITFIFNYSAYFCEIFRGGILSVNKGQYEAAQVLGYTKWQTNLKIMLPQMLRVALPAITNESITLVKDTALITAVGVTEILYFAEKTVNRDVNVTAYAVAAVFYLILTFGLTKLFNYLEKKMSY